MSTGLNCNFIEPAPGEWYYVLEDGDAPKNAWSWREYARAFGPFATQEAAREHLHAHHANPGGHSVIGHAEYRSDATYEELIAAAPENTRKRSRYGLIQWW